MQIATELVHSPSVLILDEPTKGLDSKLRAEIFRILRSIALRGACVIVVTHAQEELPRFFDRELRIEDHKVVEDKDIGLSQLAHQTSQDIEGTSLTETGAPTKTQSKLGAQIPTLVHRKSRLILGSWVPRVLVGCIVLPAVFALSISWATSGDDQIRIAGFLHILACIWMGASTSILSIAGERELFDHERNLFLQPFSYLFAKTFTHGLLVALQALIFLATLFILQDGSKAFYQPVRVFGTLWLTGFAAQNLALLISGISYKSVNAANVILPMVMMAQIVFSTAVGKPDKVEARDGYRHMTSEEGDKDSSSSWYSLIPAQFTLSWHADIVLRKAVLGEDLPSTDTERRLNSDSMCSFAVLNSIVIFSFLLCWSLLATRIDTRGIP